MHTLHRWLDVFDAAPTVLRTPGILLPDREGKVVFEGDPGLRRGEQWKVEDGPTYVDAALDKLLGA